ncbi:MAG TPA: BatD family protein [Candidatus Krumholzibacteria bacterium]|nr:BatD family protein [Candidatus Krumholzibacteria bacterium]
MFRAGMIAVMALVVAQGMFAPTVRADDDISVRAVLVPAVVPVGEQTVLTVEVQGKFRNSVQPELPPMDNFEMYQAGTSQNFSFVNGQATSSIIFTYVLVPRQEGTYTIAPIRFTVGGKQYTANTVTLEVVAGQSAVPAPSTASPAPGSARSRDLPGEDESIFVAATVDRDTVYVNQQITWTLGYYTDGRVELMRSPNYSPPSAEGFWVEDLPPQTKYYTNLHGRQYLVSEIKRGFFPTAPGTYSIGAARVDIIVDDFHGRSIDDFFSRGLRGNMGQQRTLETEAVQIVVLPLPARGKPAGFSGAVVQDLDVSIAADKQTAQVGEPINVTIEMNGTGNMRTLIPPKLDGIDNFKVYESGSSTDSFKKDYVVSGRRKFDFVLVPQAEGKYTIPPVRVPYFDPARGAYTVAQSAPIPVDVKPGTAEDGPRVVYAGGDDFRVLNRDIRFIHPVPASLAAAPAPFYSSRWFVAMHALPLLAVGATLVIERRRRRYRSDVGFARASRAHRDAAQKFAQAEKAFHAGDASRGFALVHAAVFGYFADKMNLPAAGMTAADIDDYLRDAGAEEALRKSISGTIGACDAARYAAGAGGAMDGPALVNAARGALDAVERNRR